MPDSVTAGSVELLEIEIEVESEELQPGE